jgi:hypothetical protein
MKRSPARMVFRAALIGALLVPLIHKSYADPIPLFAGKSLQALQKTNVKILEEQLSIDLSLDRMKVRAVFKFKNPGERTSFPVGFPCEPAMADMAGMSCQFPLKVQAQGKTIVPEIKSVADYGRCWVWDMRLDKDETVRLELEYSAAIVNERYSVPFAGIWFIYYPLRTGANWAGPIESLRISVSIPVETIVQIGPSGYVRSPGLVEWTLADYKPQEDLLIVLDPVQTSRYIDRGLHKKRATDSDKKRLLDFAESFLKEAPQFVPAYESMSKIFPRFVFPPAQGIERTVRESYEIMRLAAQK